MARNIRIKIWSVASTPCIKTKTLRIMKFEIGAFQKAKGGK